jgi:integrase
LATDMRHKLALKRDPAAERMAEKRSITSDDNTFAAAASDFILQHAKKKTRRWQEQGKLLGLIESHGGELELIDKGLAKRWRDRPVGEIDADTIFRLIEEVRHKGMPGLGRKNGDASESRARAMHSVLSKMFNWLTEKRRVKVSPLAALKRPSAPKPRDRVLTDGEIIALWKAAEELRKPFGQLIKLLLLTGCRLNEVAQMEASELSHDRATWTISGTRTKNHRTHVVPMAPLAQDMVAELERRSDCKFMLSTNQKTPVSGFSKLKRRLDSKLKGVQPWRLHDLRRTCATGMAEIGVAPHVVELCLNHVSGARAGVAGTYNRSVQMPERRAAMERWATHVAELVSGRPQPKVVNMKGKAKRAR